MALQWRRQVAECSLMCLALQSPPSSKSFTGKTGLDDNLARVAEENFSMNKNKRSVTWWWRIMPSHWDRSKRQSYKTQKLLIFLDRLHFDLIPENESGLIGPHLPQYVIVWEMWISTRARSSGPGSLLIQGWWCSYHLTLLSSILLSFSPLGGGECMSIGLKIRGPCSMQWTPRVRILQEISVGDGCDMHVVATRWCCSYSRW